MWQVFVGVCKTTSEDAIEYFVDMMPALHNYVTVDTDAFLSDPTRLKGILQLCQQVLTLDIGEDAECHAAKMLEVVILQCKGRIDEFIQPIVEMALARSTREIKTSELRTMCIQVLIAAMQYNPQLFFHLLQTLQQPATTNVSIVDHFIKQWLSDTDCFLGLHDRRMCILGLITLISMNPRPNILSDPEMSGKLLPSCILLFEGLEKAYEAKAAREKEDSDDEDTEEDDDDDEWDDVNDDGGLGSDEDEIDDDDKAYIEMLTEMEKDSGNGADDYSEGGLVEETDLEAYDTPLDQDDCDTDEFVLFKQSLQGLEQTEADWCKLLTTSLTAEQQEKLRKIFELADKRKAVADSKNIEKVGGYQFDNQQIPQSFNFGGGDAFS